MTRNRKNRRNQYSLRLWTFEQARAASGYIASIVRSLREHALTIQNCRRRLAQLDALPGRPNRATLIAQEDARRDLHRAEDQFTEASSELEELDIYTLEPLQGTALVPFLHDDQLAWYIFDLFDEQQIRSWRFQSDPEETRRKLTKAQMR